MEFRGAEAGDEVKEVGEGLPQAAYDPLSKTIAAGLGPCPHSPLLLVGAEASSLYPFRPAGIKNAPLYQPWS